MKPQERVLPVGLQSFVEIRSEGYVYVDKTDFVWQLVNKNKKYNYLSRPRRFGKSLLVDTLHCYLEGRKELFEGLKIMELEKEWTRYPVIRFDMSRGGANADALYSYLNACFRGYEQQYGMTVSPEDKLAVRFSNIIHAAYKETGQKVAVLIDEYDSPLQHSWKTPTHEECTALYRELFAILKSDDAYIKFVFITGITKFTQISLFSVLNNLCNISFDSRFAAVCGITEQEIGENFQQEVQQMAEQNKWSLEETHQHLKEYYDGYHFSGDNMMDIYNPFSLVNALSDHKIRNYWIASGATMMLPKFVDDLEMHLEDFDHCYVDADTIESSDVTGGGPELFLYQAGYLTIKGYEDGSYILGFPNAEVRQAMYKVVIPALTMREQGQTISTQSALRVYMNREDIPEAMKCLKALIADVPYSNKKMASMDMEERYRLIISTIMQGIGFNVQVERMLALGRIDIVVWTVRAIYVLELKLHNNGGATAAYNQIDDRQYLEPFKADSRKVIGLAIELDDQGKGLVDWKIV